MKTSHLLSALVATAMLGTVACHKHNPIAGDEPGAQVEEKSTEQVLDETFKVCDQTFSAKDVSLAQKIQGIMVEMSEYKTPTAQDIREFRARENSGLLVMDNGQSQLFKLKVRIAFNGTVRPASFELNSDSTIPFWNLRGCEQLTKEDAVEAEELLNKNIKVSLQCSDNSCSKLNVLVSEWDKGAYLKDSDSKDVAPLTAGYIFERNGNSFKLSKSILAVKPWEQIAWPMYNAEQLEKKEKVSTPSGSYFSDAPAQKMEIKPIHDGRLDLELPKNNVKAEVKETAPVLDYDKNQDRYLPRVEQKVEAKKTSNGPR